MKKAIVIGATSGIGRGVAKLLATNGYRVGITGRREALLEELKAQDPAHYITSSFDITRANEVAQQLNQLVEKLGGLDLLLINSGTGRRNISLQFDIEEPAILTNVLGFTSAADWGYRYFEAQKHGHLAAVSSIAGVRGMRHAPAYGASKAYESHYLSALRHKAIQSKLDIVFTDIRPGFVDTALVQGEGVFWMASIGKAAAQIVSALQKRKKTVYVTRRWRIIAFAIPLIPKWIWNRI